MKNYSSVALTFFDHRLASFGQNKVGVSPGITNKKGTLLWDDLFPLNFCFKFYTLNSPFLKLFKLSLSLFLAKIITIMRYEKK